MFLLGAESVMRMLPGGFGGKLYGDSRATDGLSDQEDGGSPAIPMLLLPAESVMRGLPGDLGGQIYIDLKSIDGS